MRRKKFFVTLTHKTDFDLPPIRRQILAYTEEGVRDYYGHLYPQHAIKFSKHPHPPEGERAGWELLPNAIRIAQDVLGLKLPVHIRKHNRVGNTRGNYKFKIDDKGNPYHEIMSKGYLPPSQANETLWHEFTHALQAERAISDSWLEPKKAWAQYQSKQRRFSYKKRPMEIEARTRSAELAPQHTLVK